MVLQRHPFVTTKKKSPVVRALFFVAIFLLVSAGCAAALDPSHRISQYGHTAWRLQDGYFGSQPGPITQTIDGYIWVGTEGGVFRFDGVQFVPWTSLSGEQLPSNVVIALFAARDGSLWIGTNEGLLQWGNGRSVRYLNIGSIGSILQDENGVIWFSNDRTGDHTHPICRVNGTDVRCYSYDSAETAHLAAAVPLAKDRTGNFWVGHDTAVVQWRPGYTKVYRPAALKSNQGINGVGGFANAADGSVWVGFNTAGRGGGLQQVVDGLMKPFVVPKLNGEALEIWSLLIDREGSLWVGTARQGIYRIRGADVDHFGSVNGLSSDSVVGFYEDREGNLWITTEKGLDMLRDLRVTTFSASEGLSEDDVFSVLAGRDGTVWIGSNHLQALIDGTVSPELGKGLPGSFVTSLLEDHTGCLWVGIPSTQSALHRSVRDSLHRQHDEGRRRVLNDRLENESLSLEIGVAANQLAIGSQQALRLDEEKRIADEVERRVAERTNELAQAVGELQLQAGLLQHLPVSAWTLKPDGTPDFVNQVWLEFSGQTLDIVRSHPEAWMIAVHPEDRERASRVFWDGVRSGQGFVLETRSLRARDKSYRWHLQQAVVLRDAEGRVLKFVGTTTDIDDQKRGEEALGKLRSELAHMARVTGLGALTASIAHEVNQPLVGIVTNAGTCLRTLSADRPNLDSAREAARRVMRDGHRASEVISRLRALFSKKELAAESLDLNDAAREVIALCSDDLQRNQVILRREFANDLLPVTGDLIQLQQVIFNLIRNASDAMSAVNDHPRVLVIRTDRAAGDYVRLTVQDTGVGITQQEMESLFDAFYTTKSDGMGMGLSISRSIIENHGGRLWATKNDGPGATFSFSIPCAARSSKSNGSCAVCSFDPVPATQ